MRADEVAKTLGKSISTAYYLLTSLCEEGFAVHESKGVYRPARGLEELTAAPSRSSPRIRFTTDSRRPSTNCSCCTRKRSYLGVVAPGKIEIVAFRGRQGVPQDARARLRDPGQRPRAGDGQGGAVAARRGRRRALRGARPEAFTPHTITSAEALTAELERRP